MFRVIRIRGWPLAIYVFSRDTAAVSRVLANTNAGGSVVNNALVRTRRLVEWMARLRG